MYTSKAKEKFNLNYFHIGITCLAMTYVSTIRENEKNKFAQISLVSFLNAIKIHFNI